MRKTFAVLIAVALTSIPVGAQVCPSDSLRDVSWSQAARDSATAVLRARPRRSEIRLDIGRGAAEAATLVTSLLLDCGFTPSPGSAGIIEMKLPREMGWLGQYEITAHAYLTPRDSQRTTLIFKAEERMFTRNESTSPVTNDAKGRSGRVWRAFATIADSLARAFPAPPKAP